MLLISIIEIIYIIYMFIFFKTYITINHPWEYCIVGNLGKFFEHPIRTIKYSNKICQFGKIIIIPLIIYLYLRNFINLKKFNKYIILISILLSLMNMNAVLYLIPFWLIELIYNN